MTISVIDYSTASDPLAAMKAAAAERRVRLYAPPPPPPKPVVVAEPEPEPLPRQTTKGPDPLAAYRHAYEIAIPHDMQPQIAKQIIAETSQEMGVYAFDMTGQSRVETVSRARAIAMWRVADKTTLSLTQIARLFNKDHTTVIHAVRRMNDETGLNIRAMGGIRGIKALRKVSNILDWQKAKDAVAARVQAGSAA